MIWFDRLLKWVEPEDNPRSTVYGTVAAGLVIAAEDPLINTYPRLVAATAVAVASYWVAHGYAHWVAQRFQADAGSGAGWWPRALVDALAHEWPLGEGAAVPLATLLVAWAVGAPLTAATTAALSAAAGALVVFEVAGTLRRRLPLLQLAANAFIGLLLASALFAIKNLLH